MPIMIAGLSNIYTSSIKPLLDFLFAFILTIVLFPFIVILLILLLLDLNRPPIFYQMRVGKNERPFVLYKLRSLKIDGELTSSTRLSRVVRALSLDELPQLINILKGEMSFVGPRPLLPEYLAFYTSGERQRHAVRPGLTGLAQLKVGNSSDWSKRLAYDMKYVQNVSYYLDMKLLLHTAFVLFKFNRKFNQDIEIVRFDEFAKRR